MEKRQRERRCISTKIGVGVMIFINKIKMVIIFFSLFLLIGLVIGYVYMVEDDTHIDRHIILTYNQTEYIMPLILNPIIPYKVVLSQVGDEEYINRLPFKLTACIFSNGKIINTYTIESLKLGYRFENDKKLGTITLRDMLKIPLLQRFRSLELRIFIEWEKDLYVAEKFELKIITSLGEI